MKFRRDNLLIAIVLSALAAAPAQAKDGAYVGDVAMSRTESGRLAASFTLQNAMGPRVLETLESGLPVRFLYRAKVTCDDLPSWDRTVGTKDLERILEKDNLKNRYVVTEGEARHEFDTLEDATAVMSRVTDLSVVRLSKLPESGACRLEIQVRLEEFRLPFHLHRVLPFVSFWDVRTPWHLEAIPDEIRGKP
ncbi:MAG TPA: DUF4390 domain-containing protein [Geobacteraceae bacterium]